MKKNFYLLLILGVTFSMVHARESGHRFKTENNKMTTNCDLVDCNTSSHSQISKKQELFLIDVEDEVDLGFNPYLYLSPDFDPHMGMELDIDSLQLLEEEVEVILDFDASLYLPKNFNPYKGI